MCPLCAPAPLWGYFWQFFEKLQKLLLKNVEKLVSHTRTRAKPIFLWEFFRPFLLEKIFQKSSTKKAQNNFATIYCNFFKFLFAKNFLFFYKIFLQMRNYKKFFINFFANEKLQIANCKLQIAN